MQPDFPPQPATGAASRGAGRLTALALGLVLLLAAGLRFYRLGAQGYGNLYYAATVQSMLASWHNFFFAAYEPGGSVTVDKPPLGFWVQALPAKALGVNGFALALPQALAGVLSVALLYALVRRTFGGGAGLLAALALAITPIAVATDRNNTIDSQLVLVVLLATWAFLRAARSGRLRWLLMGAALVGLGFNIKMLQAFLPLPAFYALYLLGGPGRLRRRALQLFPATGLLLAVSLSWALAVDLTPPDRRPFVGSSQDNSVMELILGHNGLARLLPRRLRGGAAPGSGATPAPGSGVPGPGPRPPAGATPRPPATGQVAPAPGPGFNWEVGQPGPLRLFRQPLVDQASWLAPFALAGALVAAGRERRRFPLSARGGELLLWGLWFLTCAVFFSVANLFHTYYLVMLAPALAALAGIGAAALWGLCRERRRLGPALCGLALAAGVGFQLYVLRDYPAQARRLDPLLLAAAAAGLTLLAVRQRGPAAGFGLAALLAAPLAWSLWSALDPAPNAGLPAAGPPTAAELRGGPDAGGPAPRPDAFPPGAPPGRPPGVQPGENAQRALIAYLTPRTQDTFYLVATLSAQDASPLILGSGRPVLTFGGFSGGDPVVSAARLAELVRSGALRYVWVSPERLRGQHADLWRWMQGHCAAEPGPGGATQLFRCGVRG